LVKDNITILSTLLSSRYVSTFVYLVCKSLDYFLTLTKTHTHAIFSLFPHTHTRTHICWLSWQWETYAV